MRNVVEERRGHLWIAEHAGPLTKSEIGCDDHADCSFSLLIRWNSNCQLDRASGR